MRFKKKKGVERYNIFLCLWEPNLETAFKQEGKNTNSYLLIWPNLWLLMESNNITAVFTDENDGVMWQKDLTDFFKYRGFFNRLSSTGSLLGDVMNVRDTNVFLLL